ncbi:MAG: 16S rRNA (uracil(1498)-N(3))-methyltransferase [Rhodospirillaceae bacterium]|nr:16S rRNA (uracil(1498)-N(3))-methyltransferase [Rhodospirillaceae bacterium]
MIPRFFCPFPLHPGATVELPAEAAHHALRVLRIGPGDAAELFDGRGGCWRATLHAAGKGSLRATLDSHVGDDLEPPLRVALAQCLPAADKMDYVVQKAVELGVAAIQPVAARRSVIRLSGERMSRRVEHWRGIAAAACEQSGRNRVPPVTGIVDLPQYLAGGDAHNDIRLICLPGEGARLRELSPPAGTVHVLVGPEGGFEEAEIKAARAAGFRPLRLGPRVLRTETAGPAALAAIMGLWGDW